MKSNKILLHAAFWFSTTIAVCASIIVTKEPLCLVAFVIPAFTSLILGDE